jgi:hypothetical protein
MRNYNDKRTQKQTIDADLEAIEIPDFEFNKDKSASSGMMENITENSYAKDFAKLDNPADGNRYESTSEIEHFPESRIHTASHEIDQELFKKANKNDAKSGGGCK